MVAEEKNIVYHNKTVSYAEATKSAVEGSPEPFQQEIENGVKNNFLRVNVSF